MTPLVADLIARPADGPFMLSVAGRAFQATATGTLAGSATTNIQLTTGAKQVLVLMRDFHTEGDSLKVTFVENPTITTGTTPIASVNMNRSSTNATTVTMFSNPTSVSAGTVLQYELIGSGHKGGGGAAHDTPFTLKASEDYVFTLENIGATTLTYTMTVVWAE
jgi:hypothetical protein